MLESLLNIWIWLILGLTAASAGIAFVSIRNGRSARGSTLLEKVAVMPFSSVRQDIKNELERARRYQRRVALAVIRPGSRIQKSIWSTRNGSPGWGNGQHPRREALQAAFLALGSVLRDLFRTEDILAYNASRNLFVLLLVECSRSEATRTLRRAQAGVRERTQIGIQAGVAEFPADGLILRDLIGRAEEALSGESALYSRETPTHAALANHR